MRKNTLPHQAGVPGEAEIQKQAYHLWVEGGCLEGVELDNWLAAKELLKHRHAQPAARRPRKSTPARATASGHN
ncbi:MAG: DUF2934 domain-containing protein [Opitutaceae bacterium]|nr:DUF2934 domain-containing protein [Opitutaceae bacterium]MBP9912080.1 DUF2934 domain-containing protein [Opitutaceae bacterium]